MCRMKMLQVQVSWNHNKKILWKWNMSEKWKEYKIHFIHWNNLHDCEIETAFIKCSIWFICKHIFVLDFFIWHKTKTFLLNKQQRNRFDSVFYYYFLHFSQEEMLIKIWKDKMKRNYILFSLLRAFILYAIFIFFFCSHNVKVLFSLRSSEFFFFFLFTQANPLFSCPVSRKQYSKVFYMYIV